MGYASDGVYQNGKKRLVGGGSEGEEGQKEFLLHRRCLVQGM